MDCNNILICLGVSKFFQLQLKWKNMKKFDYLSNERYSETFENVKWDFSCRLFYWNRITFQGRIWSGYSDISKHTSFKLVLLLQQFSECTQLQLVEIGPIRGHLFNTSNIAKDVQCICYTATVRLCLLCALTALKKLWHMVDMLHQDPELKWKIVIFNMCNDDWNKDHRRWSKRCSP